MPKQLKLEWKECSLDDPFFKSISFYKKNDTTQIDSELFSTVANRWACYVSNNSGNQNTSTQLRRFYDFVRFHSSQIERCYDSECEEKVLLEFSKIESLISRNLNRDHAPINRQFEHFMLCCLEYVKDKESLKLFSSFFEAFMGFYVQYKRK